MSDDSMDYATQTANGDGQDTTYSADDSSTGDTSTGDTSTGDASTGDASTGDSGIGDGSSGNDSTIGDTGAVETASLWPFVGPFGTHIPFIDCDEVCHIYYPESGNPAGWCGEKCTSRKGHDGLHTCSNGHQWPTGWHD